MLQRSYLLFTSKSLAITTHLMSCTMDTNYKIYSSEVRLNQWCCTNMTGMGCNTTTMLLLHYQSSMSSSTGTRLGWILKTYYINYRIAVSKLYNIFFNVMRFQANLPSKKSKKGIFFLTHIPCFIMILTYGAITIQKWKPSITWPSMFVYAKPFSSSMRNMMASRFVARYVFARTPNLLPNEFV